MSSHFPLLFASKSTDLNLPIPISFLLLKSKESLLVVCFAPLSFALCTLMVIYFILIFGTIEYVIPAIFLISYYFPVLLCLFFMIHRNSFFFSLLFISRIRSCNNVLNMMRLNKKQRKLLQESKVHYHSYRR